MRDSPALAGELQYTIFNSSEAAESKLVADAAAGLDCKPHLARRYFISVFFWFVSIPGGYKLF